jgi:hypothetical protein
MPGVSFEKAPPAPSLQRTGSQGFGSGLRSLKNKAFSRAELATFGAEQEAQHDGGADMRQEVEEAMMWGEQRHSAASHGLMRDVLDISSPLNDAAAALVDDSFLRCFKTAVEVRGWVGEWVWGGRGWRRGGGRC